MIALATCVKLPEPDVDEALLVAALEARGLRVRLRAWDDDSQAPVPGELVVIRSTWNYYQDVERFLAWVDRTGATNRLLNPPAVVRANASKTYLRDLEGKGIAIVPTVFVERGSSARVEDIAQARGWEAIVIKPVISAGSYLTQRFDRSSTAAAQSFLDELVGARGAMIQRWMPSVETYGERSIVWIDGELTHAIRKSPRFGGGGEAVSPEMPIAPDERAFAAQVLGAVDVTDLLYARIDMVKDEDGILRLMELELIEPSLFLLQCPRALERLAGAIFARSR